eukprot:scaffold59245_cov36-Tisochrysis_lutea.AAC.2
MTVPLKPLYSRAPFRPWMTTGMPLANVLVAPLPLSAPLLPQWSLTTDAAPRQPRTGTMVTSPPAGSPSQSRRVRIALSAARAYSLAKPSVGARSKAVRKAGAACRPGFSRSHHCPPSRSKR